MGWGWGAYARKAKRGDHSIISTGGISARAALSSEKRVVAIKVFWNSRLYPEGGEGERGGGGGGGQMGVENFQGSGEWWWGGGDE